jgi:1-deoxy-D-xylulose-5-phosphate synthase
VGIAEQHAVTIAAGMATDGLIPFCNIYSTFLQRAYDQVIHDVAIQSLPVIFCLDRAGLVGEDGPTHHGVFDIAYLRCIPNLIICSPLNEIELRNIMYTAQLGLEHPIAIRYPRGRGTILDWQKPMKQMVIGKGELLKEGDKIAILTTGPIGNVATEIINEIEQNANIAHYNFPFIKPLDAELLTQILQKFDHIITLEDGSAIGGFGTAVLEFANNIEIRKIIKIFGIPDFFIPHGDTEKLYIEAGIDKMSVKKYVQHFL